MPDARHAEIYKATRGGKSYIGQTRNGVARRWRSHIREALAGGKANECRLLNSAIRKYGADAFAVSVVARVPLEWADAAEREAIIQHGTMAPGGYNLKEGGRVHSPSEETRKLMARRRTGRKHSAKTIAKMRATAKRRFQNPLERRKMSEAAPKGDDNPARRPAVRAKMKAAQARRFKTT